MAIKAKPVVPCTKTGVVCLYIFHAMLALFLQFYRCERVKNKARALHFLSFYNNASFLYFVVCSRVVQFIRFVVEVLNVVGLQ